MSLTIKNKLLLGFAGVSMLVLIAGSIGILKVNDVAYSANQVIDEKVPMKDAAMEAVIVMERALASAYNYTSSTANLDIIEDKLKESVGDLNMFISMLRYGTEVDKFRNSAAGKMYVKDGIDIKITATTPAIQKIAGQALTEYQIFSQAQINLVQTHQSKAKYLFDFQGATYDIRTFLFKIAIEHGKWVEAVGDAARFGAKFTGITDVKNSNYDIWYKTFKAEDPKLAKLLKKYAKLNKKAYKWVKKLNKAKGKKKQSYFERMRSRQLNKMKRSLDLIVKYVAPLYQNMEQQEQIALTEMVTSATKLEDMLEKLEGVVDQEVNLAKNNTHSTQSSAKIILIGTVILAIIVSLIAGFLIVNSIVKPINVLARIMGSVEETGDFSERVKVINNDEIGSTVQAFNSLMNNLELAISSVNEVMGAIADGKFNLRVEEDLTGDLATLKESVNRSSGSVDTTMQALEDIMEALARGDFSQRLSDNVKGDLKDKVDNAMGEIEAGISDISRVMQSVSNGDFQQRSSVNLQGDMLELQQHINSSVEKLNQAMEDIIGSAVSLSSGDLTDKVSGNYSGQLNDLKVAVDGATEGVDNIVVDISNAAISVQKGASEVATGSNELASRTSEQAAFLEQTSTAMEEISSTIAINADNSVEAVNLSVSARDNAVNGGDVVKDAISAMDSITGSSDKISEIIGVIDGIAFQTNLLALNAAVEAARAGEHGRGFAVVASEVRGLAQRSADAAKEIKELIEESSDNVAEGAKLVHQSGDVLESIIGSITKVSDIVNEISSASKEQSKGVEQVSSSISSMDEATQQNSNLVEESSLSSKNLSNASTSLLTLVENFKVSGS